MDVQPANAYTYRSNYNTSNRGTNVDARNNSRADGGRGTQQEANAFSSQNSSLLLALQQLIQILMQQLQEKPGNPPAHNPPEGAEGAEGAPGSSDILPHENENQSSVTGQPLSLSQQQLANIGAGVRSSNPDTISILDQDASGTVSEGDVFKYPEFLFPSDSFCEHTLTGREAALINGEFGSPLRLNDEEKRLLGLGLDTRAESFGAVFDRDGSGTLSTGDIALGFPKKAYAAIPKSYLEFPTSYITLHVSESGKISVAGKGDEVEAFE